MPSVFGETVTFSLKGLTEAEREKLGQLLSAGEGVEPATLAAAKRGWARAAIRRAHDVERQQQEEAAQATVKPTPLGEPA